VQSTFSNKNYSTEKLSTSFYFLIRSNNKKAKQNPLTGLWGKQIN